MNIQSNKKTFWLKILVLFIFLLDITYTFKQNYGNRLDGDLVPIVLPAEHYAKVLTDPFGIDVLIHKERYAGTNRYFCHKTMQIWFNNVYHLIAYFFSDKVTALYVCSALFNTLVYVLFLIAIILYIHLQIKINKLQILITLLLAMSFIQTKGFYSISLIDKSITYTFFYGYPLCVLLIYLFPLYKYSIRPTNYSYSIPQHIIWIFLSIYLAFGGTLVQPFVLLSIAFIVCIYSILLLLNSDKTRYIKDVFSYIRNMPKVYLFHVCIFPILCLYSFYIGKYNIENPTEMPSLYDRYLLLLKGIVNHFSLDIAFCKLLFFK